MAEEERELQEECDQRNNENNHDSRRSYTWKVQGGQMVLVEE